jgi:hypothetical protein
MTSLKRAAIVLLKFRHAIVLPIAVFIVLSALAQTNISGVVNNYYRVIEVIPAKACVRLNSVVGLAPLQKTLLIQIRRFCCRQIIAVLAIQLT